MLFVMAAIAGLLDLILDQTLLRYPFLATLLLEEIDPSSMALWLIVVMVPVLVWMSSRSTNCWARVQFVGGGKDKRGWVRI